MPVNDKNSYSNNPRLELIDRSIAADNLSDDTERKTRGKPLSERTALHNKAAIAHRAVATEFEQKIRRKAGDAGTKKLLEHHRAKAQEHDVLASGGREAAAKSEPPIAHMAGQLAQIDALRKASFDDRGIQTGQSFSDYAAKHAQQWAENRQGLAPEEAHAYSQHYVQTYPTGEDEHGNSIDHPTAYRNWKMDQESAAERARPKVAPTPPPPKPKRRKAMPAVTSERITWMHGQKPTSKSESLGKARSSIPAWMMEDEARMRADPELGRTRNLSGSPITDEQRNQPAVDYSVLSNSPAPAGVSPSTCPTCSSRGVENHLIDNYHTSRTALSDKPASERTEWHRRNWAAKAFDQEHPGFGQTKAYKLLDRALARR